MTNSTSDEREQRLKQIRERSESRKRVAGKFQWAQVSTQEWSDIDFLLSLIDSEAAGGDGVDAIMAGLETRLNGHAENAIGQAVELGAASMRSLCVEKVKSFEREHRLNMTLRAHRELKKLISDILDLEAAANETREDGNNADIS